MCVLFSLLAENAATLSKKDGWTRQNVTLTVHDVSVVFEAARGGYSDDEDKGDVSIDDVRVIEGACGEKISQCMLSSKIPTERIPIIVN